MDDSMFDKMMKAAGTYKSPSRKSGAGRIRRAAPRGGFR